MNQSSTSISHNRPTTSPLVSVVIPLYNNELYVKDAIGSVINQSYPNIEIIVVNDGSSDNSVASLAHLKDKIKLISQTNQGSAVARNRGMSEAQGEYIAFLDADDLWTPYKVEVQTHFLLNHPQYELVCGIDERVDMHYSASSIQQEIGKEPTLNEYLSGWQYQKLLFSCPYHINNLMLRKSALKQMQFAPHLRRGQDLDFWFQLCSQYKIAYLDVVFSYYRENPASISYKLQAQNVKLNILKTALQRTRNKQACVSFWDQQKAFSSACVEYAYSARLFKKPNKALLSYFKSMYYNPLNTRAYSGAVATCLEWLGLKSAPVLSQDVH